jgi:glycosyltransferase involved in cell wall biosynthesis
MQKKKITIVINSLKLGGGAEKVASTIGNELSKRGYEVSFLVFTSIKNEYKYQGNYVNIGKGIKTRNSIEALFAIFKRAWRIKKYCKENNIDTIISFMEEANFASIISKKLFRNNIKVIASVHRDPDTIKSKAKKISKFLYSKASKIVVVSNGIKIKLEQELKLNNIQTIYNPVDFKKIEQLKEEDVTELSENIFRDNFIFINIGRLIKTKNQEFLIKAFKEINNKYSNTKLIILGDGELRIRLEKIIKDFNLTGQVFLLGNQKNVYKYLNRSNCFISSSYKEGLGISAVEALNLKLPIIAVDCLGLREVLSPELNKVESIHYPYINNSGVLIENNKNQLKEEMESIIKKQYHFTSGNEIKRFDLNKIVNEWERLL